MAENISYSQLISSEHQQELINMGESTLEKSFRVGQIANEEASVMRENVTNDFIYRGVAALYGEKARTIREYADMQGFYQDSWKHYEILSFAHFRFAYKYRDDNWEEILRWAVESADGQGGRPSTVNACIERFAYSGKNKTSRFDRVLKSLDKIQKDVEGDLSRESFRAVAEHIMKIKIIVESEVANFDKREPMVVDTKTGEILSETSAYVPEVVMVEEPFEIPMVTETAGNEIPF